VKVICGLGNPGAEYEETRHNVGWWVVEEAQATWRFPKFQRADAVWISQGRVGDHDVVLVEPLTYMNRSGAALAALPRLEDFDIARDLLVVVDDVSLDVGRVRFRARGSAGGHNGLKSVETTLGTQEYARLRIGVGAPPPGANLADWVLAPFDAEDEDAIVVLFLSLVDALGAWLDEGVEAAGNRFNR
jgi:peptidyl-tRNA hydrolase, PTH1 family